jgi:hypothetical protein
MTIEKSYHRVLATLEKHPQTAADVLDQLAAHVDTLQSFRDEEEGDDPEEVVLWALWGLLIDLASVAHGQAEIAAAVDSPRQPELDLAD